MLSLGGDSGWQTRSSKLLHVALCKQPGIASRNERRFLCSTRTASAQRLDIYRQLNLVFTLYKNWSSLDSQPGYHLDLSLTIVVSLVGKQRHQSLAHLERITSANIRAGGHPSHIVSHSFYQTIHQTVPQKRPANAAQWPQSPPNRRPSPQPSLRPWKKPTSANARS